MNIETYKRAYAKFLSNKDKFSKMYEYYKGNTDAIQNYQQTDRANLEVNTNYMKKFIKEEISYSIGNDITYISKSGNTEMISAIDNEFETLSEKHDIELMKTMLIFGIAFELYYIDNLEFKSKILKPTEGCISKDKNGNITFFMRIFSEEIFDVEEKTYVEKTFIDVYTQNEILHFDGDFNVVSASTKHEFGCVPIGDSCISEEVEKDTIYNDIKGLQDAFETNLSDICNEISDFRNSYLVTTGVKIDKEEATDMKKLGLIQIPTADGKVTWLIKNINDSFIQNTLNTVEDKMYQLTFHINTNEKMQSNTSSLALRTRLLPLEEKCKLNQKALMDCIKARIKCLFIYLKITKDIDLDYKDVKIKFTANVPSDDLVMAQIVSQLGENISLETALSLFSFIENPSAEVKKIQSEQEPTVEGNKLLEGANNE